MKRSAVFPRIVAVVLATLFLSSCLTKKAYTVKMINNQVAFKAPMAWSQHSWPGWSTVELTRSRKTTMGTVNDAHMVVFTEKRRGSDEAVVRLREIASESKVPSTFLLIDGWPAMQRRQTVAVPRPGAEDSEATGPQRQTVQVTTAIAANDIVVRSEGSIPISVKGSIVDEVEKMGRSFTFASRPSRSTSEDRLRELRSEPERPPIVAEPPPFPRQVKRERSHTFPGAPSPAAGQMNGELEVAASKDGRHVVVAGQSATIFFSDDGGITFKTSARTLPAMLGNRGDPSIARGASDAFYVAFLTTPGGACGTALMSSAPNNGATFTFDANAVLCPAAGNPQCSPDQEHIAADPNPSSTGSDQVYLVYRHYTPLFGGNCPLGNTFYPFPSITCSADNGKSWLSPAPIAAGDFPRITVGPDGFVWVVQRSYEVITVSKFSSCETGLQPQPGFPRKVVSVSDPMCPLPGLDRCNDGNSLSSATIAVDQSDTSHIFIAYANSTSSANDDIVVVDTTDAFASAPSNIRTVTVNNAVAGRRFMPWMCTIGSSAQVTWYDRRFAKDAKIDLTDYFRGSASVVGGTLTGGKLVGGALVSGTEVDVSNASDPQCAPGFPCGARDAGDVNSCPKPHNDGTCQDGQGMGSKTSCDRDSKICPAGESCVANGNDNGCPKYGDYNGTACAAGHVFAAWASATPPPALPKPNGIGLFVDALNCGGVGQACCSVGSACILPGLSCGADGTCSAPACGGLGQACCDGNCAAPNGCSATTNTCVACPPPPITLVDAIRSNGADCGGTSHDFDFQNVCDPGFGLGACSASLTTEPNGSTCTATPTGGCNCRLRITTPQDCFKSASCRIVVTEKPTGPIPAGCPAP